MIDFQMYFHAVNREVKLSSEWALYSVDRAIKEIEKMGMDDIDREIILGELLEAKKKNIYLIQRVKSLELQSNKELDEALVKLEEAR